MSHFLAFLAGGIVVPFVLANIMDLIEDKERLRRFEEDERRRRSLSGATSEHERTG